MKTLQIRLKALSALGEVVGRSLALELKGGNTAKHLLEKLDSLYGEGFKKYTGEKLMDAIRKYNMIVNKKALRFPKDLGFQLNDGDYVVLLRASGGG